MPCPEGVNKNLSIQATNFDLTNTGNLGAEQSVKISIDPQTVINFSKQSIIYQYWSNTTLTYVSSDIQYRFSYIKNIAPYFQTYVPPGLTVISEIVASFYSQWNNEPVLVLLVIPVYKPSETNTDINLNSDVPLSKILTSSAYIEYSACPAEFWNESTRVCYYYNGIYSQPAKSPVSITGWSANKSTSGNYTHYKALTANTNVKKPTSFRAQTINPTGAIGEDGILLVDPSTGQPYDEYISQLTEQQKAAVNANGAGFVIGWVLYVFLWIIRIIALLIVYYLYRRFLGDNFTVPVPNYVAAATAKI